MIKKTIVPQVHFSTKDAALIGKSLKDLAASFQGMSKEQLLEVVNAHLLPFVDPEKYKELIRANMPDFVKEMDTKEALAASAFQTNQEFLLVIIDCLKRYHGWSDIEIKKLHGEIVDVLTGVKEFEDSGLSILSPHSVAVVGDKVQEIGVTKLLAEIRRIRYGKNEINRIGMLIPNELEGSKLDKALQKPRR